MLAGMKDQGYELVLWSARGKERAEMAAAMTDKTDLFEAILAKPSYIIDDKGWTWVKFVRCLPAGPSGGMY
jgi:hypothetical protein